MSQILECAEHPEEYDLLTDESIISGLSSDSFRQRQRIGAQVHKTISGDRLGEVSKKLAEKGHALYGWIEYCLRNNLPIEESDVESVYEEYRKNYADRKQIADYSYGDRENQALEEVSIISQRLQNLSRLLMRNPNMVRLSVLIRARIMRETSQDIEATILLLESHPEILGVHIELMEILAWAYEQIGQDEKAFDIYEDLQCTTGQLKFLEKEIEILYRLGRPHEADCRYRFMADVEDSKIPKLRPKAYYRMTIEDTTDLAELDIVLERVLMGDLFDERSSRILKSAEEYIEKRLKVLSKKIKRLLKKTGQLYHPDAEVLHLEFLYLLEISACVLLLVPGKNKNQMRGIHRYLYVLSDHYDDYRKNPAGSILNAYFGEYNRDFINRIRKLQCEETRDENSEGKFGDTITPETYEGIPYHLTDTLEFLFDRTDSPTPENRVIQGDIEELHNRIAAHIVDIEPINEEDFEGCSQIILARVAMLHEEEQRIYEGLRKYVIGKYGRTVFELVSFYAHTIDNFSELALDAIRTDPNILLYSILTTLLGGGRHSYERLSYFVLDPILEALDPTDAYFLSTMLFREGYYSLLAEFLLDDAYLLGRPEFLELFLLTLSYCSELEAIDFLDDCECEMLPDRYGFDTIEAFIDSLEGEIRGGSSQSHLTHARFLYTRLQDEKITFETFSLDPIPPGTRLTRVQASQYFSIFRSLPYPSSQREKDERITYLESLYPFMGFEKQPVIEAIFLLAAESPSQYGVIRKYLRTAGLFDEVSLGLWKYFPGVLGTEEQFRHTLGSLASDPNISFIPEEILYRIHRRPIDTLHSGHLLQRQFILLHSRDSLKEVLEAGQSYFQLLGRVLAIHSTGQQNWSENYDLLCELIRPEGYSESKRQTSINSEFEYRTKIAHLILEQFERIRNHAFEQFMREANFAEQSRESEDEPGSNLWRDTFTSCVEIFREFGIDMGFGARIERIIEADIQMLLSGEPLSDIWDDPKEERKIEFEPGRVIH